MIKYDKIKIDGLDIFYREAGMRNLHTIVLLHGFPTSSHMFRRLIPALQDRFHLIAPDYPGFGNSSMPTVDEFDYCFDNIANIIGKFSEKMGLERFGIYLMDYGAPVGFRIAVNEPERIESLIIQNGNAYDEGLREFWIPIKRYWKDRSPENEQELRKLLTLGSTKWQYTNGVRDVRSISPDNWNMDQLFLDRPGNDLIQLRLFYDYRTNLPLYPEWQDYMRKHQPPALIVWGKNDVIFPAEGAHPYKKDLENIDFNLLDTGHFALEEDCSVIADKIIRFYDTRVAPITEAPRAEAR